MNQQCSLNTILYGPPGTGKTYNTINYAVAIIEDKAIETIRVEAENNYAEVKNRFDLYKEQGRIAFTTFHQSYGYEDFIEGIRPVLVSDASPGRKDDSEQGEAETDGESDGKAEKSQSGDVKYSIHDGVFKKFCERANEASDSDQQAVASESANNDSETVGALNKKVRALMMLDEANDVVWKVSIGGSLRESRSDLEDMKQLHDICFKEGSMRIGWDQYGANIDRNFDFTRGKNGATGGKNELISFIYKAKIGDIVISLRSETEIDGIGIISGDYEWTGVTDAWKPEYDYYNRARRVNWLVTDTCINILDANQGKKLNQRTFYKTTISKESIKQLLSKELESQRDRPSLFDLLASPLNDIGSTPFVFIIDEINRGNISKIFGELITLIEPNKRLGADEETKATLPYSGEEFGVPKNVYILGTMNTADRSIALLDTALRRRFNFVEMMPEPGRLADIEVEETGIDLAKMLQTMNNRIEFLLDREHTIGHAYFMGDFQKNPTLDGLADIFRNKIVPLLQEYFFDDYSKIRLVLGDNAKPWDDQFVQEETNHASLFAGTPIDIDLDKPTYRINPGAFERVEAYTGIYA